MCMKVMFRILIAVINIVVSLIGFGIVAGGAMILLADKIAGSQLKDLLDQVGDIAGSIGFTTEDSTVDSDQLVADVMAFANDGAISMIIVGAVIFGLGILGCCGACCMWKTALLIYAIAAFVIALVMAVVVGMLFQGNFKEDIKDQFQKMIDDKYAGIDSYIPESMLINFVQLRYECCGIDDYQDFDTAEEWPRTREYETDEGYTTKKTLITPIACCKTEGDFPDVEPVHEDCATIPNDGISNWKIGCYGEVMDEINQYKTYIQAVLIILIILIFLLSIGAFSIFADETCCNKKVSPI